MSKEDLERFREMVFLDLSLQEQLRGYRQSDLFIDNVIRIAGACNLSINIEDVKEEMQSNRRRLLFGNESAGNAR